MTTQAQLGVSALDDTMELATSPFQNVDDFEIDFDNMDNPDVHSTADYQLDDMADDSNAVDDMMQGDEKDDLLEDEPMDEPQETGHDQNDFEMDEAHLNDGNHTEPQDDDVLYDEEDEAGTIDEKLEKGEVDHAVQDDDPLGVPELDPEDETTHPETSALPEEHSHPTDPETEVTISADPEVANADGGTEDGDAIPEGLEEQSAAALTESVNLAQTSKQESLEVPATDAPVPSDHDAEVAPAENAQDPAEFDQGNEALVEDSAVQEALHAIRVDWAGKSFPLFPATDGDASQSFVSDTSLAYESLSKLLAECHHVIKPELDRAFEDELVLDVDPLGLHICEDSRYAEQLSLAHVVEVYILLKRNEADENIDPLPCRISSRTCLRSQFDYLHDAAKQRRTFASIVSETASNSPLAVEAEHEEVVEEPGNSLAEEVHAQQVVAEEGEDLATVGALEDDADADATAEVEPLVNEEQANEPPQADQGKAPEATGLDSVEPIDDQVAHGSPAQKAQDEVGEDDDFAAEDLFEDLGDEEAEEPASLDVEQEPTGEADGSASSYTVEGESKLFEDELDATQPHELLDKDDEHKTLQPTVDGADAAGADQTTGDDNEDYIYNSDDELLNAQEPDTEAATSQNQLTTGDEDDTDAHNNGHQHDLLTSGVDELVAPPITPQKAVPAKRKAPEEEEEEDLLDFGFDTPEPKRQRPS